MNLAPKKPNAFRCNVIAMISLARSYHYDKWFDTLPIGIGLYRKCNKSSWNEKKSTNFYDLCIRKRRQLKLILPTWADQVAQVDNCLPSLVKLTRIIAVFFLFGEYSKCYTPQKINWSKRSTTKTYFNKSDSFFFVSSLDWRFKWRATCSTYSLSQFCLAQNWIWSLFIDIIR